MFIVFKYPFPYFWKVDVKIVIFFIVNGNCVRHEIMSTVAKGFLWWALCLGKHINTGNFICCTLYAQCSQYSHFIHIVSLNTLFIRSFEEGDSTAWKQCLHIITTEQKRAFVAIPEQMLWLWGMAMSVWWSDGQPLWSTRKYFNNVWMDWYKIVYRHS